MSGPAPPPADDAALEQLGINVIRGLAMDAPEAANSGHTGTAMALAPLAHVLWTRVMRHDPSDPTWPDRDRFVLSNGHASILLYSMLYLTGYDLTLDDLKAFRQWGSRDPGPPRTPPHRRGRGDHRAPRARGWPTGWAWAWPSGAAVPVRPRAGATTTPSSSPATAASRRASPTRRPRWPGTSGWAGWSTSTTTTTSPSTGRPSWPTPTTSPSASPPTAGTSTTIGEVANDTAALEAALRRAMAVEDRPSLIVLRSHIGWPSPTPHRHRQGPRGPLRDRGDPGDQGRSWACPPDETFWVPDEVLDLLPALRAAGPGHGGPSGRSASTPGTGDRAAWDAAWAGRGWPAGRPSCPTFEAGQQMATRKAVNACLTATADLIPGLVAGCGRPHRQHRHEAGRRRRARSAEHPGGRQVYYGIREHGMGAVMTGMAHHGGVLPVGRDLLRLQRLHARCRAAGRALEGPRHLLVDPRLGGPGPGRPDPPADRAAGLPAGHARPPGGPPGRRQRDARRPGGSAVDGEEPDRPACSPARASRSWPRRPSGPPTAWPGAATCWSDPDGGPPDVVLVGTGSEVHVCLGAAGRCSAAAGVRARVVSLPCWEWFEDQDEAYRAEVLPPGSPGWRSRRRRRSAGTATPTPASPSTPSAPRPPARWPWPSSASPPSTWPTAPGHSWGDRCGPTPQGGPGRPGDRAPDAHAWAGPNERPGPLGPRDRTAATTRRMPMTRLHELYDRSGQSPWLDNLRRDWLDERPAGRAGRPGDPRHHLQPDDLRQGHRGRGRLRRAVRSLVPRVTVEDAYWELVIADITDALEVLRPVRPERGCRRLRLLGGGPVAGPRHRGHGQAGPGAAPADRPSPTCW